MDLEFGGSEDDEDDEALMNETPAQKRLRLAKNYIDTLQHAGGKHSSLDRIGSVYYTFFAIVLNLTPNYFCFPFK